MRCPYCGEPVPKAGDYEGERRSCIKPECARLLVWRGGHIGWDFAAKVAVKPQTQVSGCQSPLALADPTPWEGQVELSDVLEELVATIKRYVALSDDAAVAVALWVAHAHAHNSVECSPLLAITSPEKRSGKTTLRRVVGAVVPRPLQTANVSPAALYRAIEKYRPSLLMDEGDAWLIPRKGESESQAALRGIINAGHYRDDCYVLRCEGENRDVTPFSVWCPKVVTLIGALPETVADRAIEARLKRRLPSEVVKRLDRKALASLQPLQRKLFAWSRGCNGSLHETDPEVPPLDDRAADNWRPLLAIADLAGGEWPERARRAAIRLSEGRLDTETARILLLEDLREIFETCGKEAIETADILQALISLDERPWSTWSNGKPLTTHALARLLAPFGAKPHKSHESRVYRVLDLADAWARYLPPSPRIWTVSLRAALYVLSATNTLGSANPSPPSPPIPPRKSVQAPQSLSGGKGCGTEEKNASVQAPQSLSGGGGGCQKTAKNTGFENRSADSDCGAAALQLGGEGGVGERGGSESGEFFTISIPLFVGINDKNYGPYLCGARIPQDLPPENLAALRARGATTTTPPPPEAAHCPRCGGVWVWGLSKRWVWSCCGEEARP
jgi:hypothetical protein